MEDGDGDGVYIVIVVVENNFFIIYKFKNGVDGWEFINISIGDNCIIGDFVDCFFDVGEMDMMVDVVCFVYCVICDVVDVDEVIFE